MIRENGVRALSTPAARAIGVGTEHDARWRAGGSDGGLEGVKGVGIRRLEGENGLHEGADVVLATGVVLLGEDMARVAEQDDGGHDKQDGGKTSQNVELGATEVAEVVAHMKRLVVFVFSKAVQGGLFGA